MTGYRYADIPPAVELAAMLRDGATVQQIAEDYGTTHVAVTGSLKRAGYSTRARDHKNLHAEPGLPFDDQPWADDALCRQTDPEAFFPEKGGSTRQAKRICYSCYAIADCREWALARREPHGVWGGLSERDRHRLTRGDDGHKSTPTGVYIRLQALGVTSAQIRAWAREADVQCPTNGTVPARIVDQWEHANNPTEGRPAA